ncbi:MAG TPA: glycosyltransferase family 4 protein [Candidatus Polarisedimenticolaceae bacterium]|nr:glycosyltransferase family 4 protein [Candidatus Polarisedimenticolaceae bacterium]
MAVVAEAWGRSGGIAQFNRNLIEAVADRPAVELSVLALLGATDGAPAAVDVRVPAPGSKTGFARAALVLARRARPELILNGTVGFGPLALALKAIGRARLWTTSHGIDVWQPGGWLDNLGLRRSDLVTTVSEYTRRRLCEWSGIPTARVRVLHNAIDLARYRPGPKPERLVARYGARGRKVMLTVGRLSAGERYKGHDRVIPLLGRLAERVGPVLYVIAGSGDDRARLERLVDSCGVSALVRFAGFVPDEELPEHYRLADVFVMPSTGEGFGIVFLEAMACGCPVIAGNRDGSVDALAHGELGRLVDPDSPGELLEAIAQALAEGRSQERAVPGVERFAVARFRERVAELVESLRGG